MQLLLKNGIAALEALVLHNFSWQQRLAFKSFVIQLCNLCLIGRYFAATECFAQGALNSGQALQIIGSQANEIRSRESLNERWRHGECLLRLSLCQLVGCFSNANCPHHGRRHLQFSRKIADPGFLIRVCANSLIDRQVALHIAENRHLRSWRCLGQEAGLQGELSNSVSISRFRARLWRFIDIRPALRKTIVFHLCIKRFFRFLRHGRHAEG